jgi:hypothetical protein
VKPAFLIWKAKLGVGQIERLLTIYRFFVDRCPAESTDIRKIGYK